MIATNLVIALMTVTTNFVPVAMTGDLGITACLTYNMTGRETLYWCVPQTNLTYVAPIQRQHIFKSEFVDQCPCGTYFHIVRPCKSREELKKMPDFAFAQEMVSVFKARNDALPYILEAAERIQKRTFQEVNQSDNP